MSNLPAKIQSVRSLLQRGEFAQAQSICEKIIRVHPNQSDALNLLGQIAAQAKDLERALRLFNKAIAIDPNYAAAHCNRGLALQELHQLDAALASYDRAVALKPDHAVAHFNRGNALKDRGQANAALASYDRAIEIDRGFARAHYNRGVLLQEMNLREAALSSFDRAVAVKPDYAEAFYNRGVVLQSLQQWDAALMSYDRALAINPGYVEAWNNRGVVLHARQELHEALLSYDRAIAIEPDFPNAHYGRGSILLELRQLNASIVSFDKAIELGCHARGLHGFRRHAKMQLCDWRDFDAERLDLAARIERHEPASPPFHVLVMSDSGSLQRTASEAWSRGESPANSKLPAIPRTVKCDRIKIAYFSADYHDHATSRLIAELFELHDRRRFEVTAVSFGPDSQDAMRRRLEGACDRIIDVRQKTDEDVALLVRGLRIDIAVDLMGFTQNSRPGIFSLRAAPLQVAYLGYPGTTGADHMDYVIADRTLVPAGHERYFSERIIYLPDSYQVNDRKRAIADRVFTREELGLPATDFVFCCFNNSHKITPGIFDSWMRILNRVDGSVLWLLEDNPTAAHNLRREAEHRQVDAQRLIFAARMPTPEHLSRHRAADLFLDTLPYTAHTTASDALWTGLPVLTRMGEAFASRVAASLLTALRMPELIVASPTQYEDSAVQFATHPLELARLKQRLESNRLAAPLFDTPLLTKHMEAGYRMIYERYHADLPPAHVSV